MQRFQVAYHMANGQTLYEAVQKPEMADAVRDVTSKLDAATFAVPNEAGGVTVVRSSAVLYYDILPQAGGMASGDAPRAVTGG